MPFDAFLSPGVFTREVDETFAAAGIVPQTGTVVGLTKKGRAFVPIRVNGYSDYVSKFGGLGEKYLASYAAKSYLKNADSVYVCRILGKDNVTLGRSAHIAFPTTGNGVTGTFATLALAGPSLVTAGILRSRDNSSTGTLCYSGSIESCTLSSNSGSITVSFNPLSENYIKKVLGTDPTRVFPGDSLTSWYVDTSFDYSLTSYALTSITGALTANAAMVTGAGNSITGGYTSSKSPSVVSQNFNGSVYELFKIHSLSDGEASNYDIKVAITNVETLDSSLQAVTYPKFDISIRVFTDSDRRKEVYEYYSGVTLNPSDKNFIARAIGDKREYADVTVNPPEIAESGQYTNISKFVRVEVFEGYPETARPSGFKGITKGAAIKLIPSLPYKSNAFDHNGEVNESVFMGVDFNQPGIVDRIKSSVTNTASSASGTVTDDAGFIILATSSETSLTANISSSYSTIVNVSNASSSAFAQQGKIRFSFPLFGGFNGYSQETDELTLQANGSLTGAYIDASKIIANTRAFDTNLIVTPGINSYTPGNIVEKILEQVESRKDSFYIIDLADTTSATGAVDTTIANAVTQAAKYDTSYAAAYYPWLKIYDEENDKYVWVPPSVKVFGAYSFNDKVSQLWISPAGFNRAGLTDVVAARKKITDPQSDTLYNGKINPIVTFATEGIVIFGQKTLQRKTSALDRINVRRMLLEVRKRVSIFSKTSLFEPNDSVTREALSNVINTYLRRVQELRGVYDFRVVLDDTTTTPDLVDRNIIAGKIFLKPTRTAEYISIDFIVSATNAEFNV